MIKKYYFSLLLSFIFIASPASTQASSLSFYKKHNNPVITSVISFFVMTTAWLMYENTDHPHTGQVDTIESCCNVIDRITPYEQLFFNAPPSPSPYEEEIFKIFATEYSTKHTDTCSPDQLCYSELRTVDEWEISEKYGEQVENIDDCITMNPLQNFYDFEKKNKALCCHKICTRYDLVRQRGRGIIAYYDTDPMRHGWAGLKLAQCHDPNCTNVTYIKLPPTTTPYLQLLDIFEKERNEAIQREKYALLHKYDHVTCPL